MTCLRIFSCGKCNAEKCKNNSNNNKLLDNSVCSVAERTFLNICVGKKILISSSIYVQIYFLKFQLKEKFKLNNAFVMQYYYFPFMNV